MNKLTLGVLFLKALFSNNISPFIVSWSITHRCNLQCRYCGVDKLHFSREPDVFKIKEVVGELYRCGTRVMKFTGGEPLIRDDIAEIVNFSHNLGMYVTLSTNGHMFAERIRQIEHLDFINISIDGPESVHDAVRGKGSYAVAEKALVVAKSKKIMVGISTVLSTINLDSLEYVLKLAEHYRVKVFFQPAVKNLLFTNEQNPISPEVSRYKSAILRLMSAKKTSATIGNSLSGLKHLYSWPVPRRICCKAGKVFCRLDTEGQVSFCSKSIDKIKEANIIKQGVQQSMEQLKSFHGCDECWYYPLIEVNLLCQYKVDTLMGMLF